jgi:hypothetical protein
MFLGAKHAIIIIMATGGGGGGGARKHSGHVFAKGMQQCGKVFLQHWRQFWHTGRPFSNADMQVRERTSPPADAYKLKYSNQLILSDTRAELPSLQSAGLIIFS